MKRSVLLIIILLATVIGYNQNYHPILKNVGWCEEEAWNLAEAQTPYYNNGDTILDNIHYTKLSKFPLFELFLLREDTILQKVWVILPGSNTETLLYDFSLSVGMQITANYYSASPVLYTVLVIDSINTPLGLRKRIKLSTTDTTYNPDLYWIEGVGSTYGPVYLYDPTYNPSMSSYHCLICSYIDIGVQSYVGSCGIYCFTNYWWSPCYSFMTEVKSITKDISEFIIKRINSDEICIESDNDIIKELKIFSIEGRLLKSIPNLNTDEYFISTKNWSFGLYIIEITNKKGLKISLKVNK